MRYSDGVRVMKVLVTGAGGFIGSHLTEGLLHSGFDVRGLDDFSTGRHQNVGRLVEEVEFIHGDVRDYDCVRRAVARCEMVFHQAALPSVQRSVEDPLTSHSINVTGTLSVLLAARDAGVRRVVFASSSSIYGGDPTLPKRENLRPAPVSPYAVGKLAAEGYCRSFSEVYGVESIALRYFNVFGPRQDPASHYAAAVPRFILAALSGRRPTVFGDGTQSRDFTYVANVVEANLLAAKADVARAIVLNTACGRRVTINRLIEAISRITGRDVHPVYAAARPGEVRHSVADVSRAESYLGYRPTVSLEEGLRRTVASYGGQLEAEPAGQVAVGG